MIKLLTKLFIKNKDDIKNPLVRRAYGIMGGIFGIVTNLLLFLAKIIIGLLIGNVSIIADAINNLSDIGSSFIAVFGFTYGAKPADKKHPYGHARMEYVATLCIAFLIVTLGMQTLITSIEDIFNPKPINDMIILPAIMLGVAMLVKLYQSYFNFTLGKKIDSTTLKATAADSRNDVIATGGVLISLLVSYFTKVNLDGYFAAVVSLIVAFSGLKMIIATSNILLGEKPETIIINEFVKKIKSYPGVYGLHDLEMHSYGPSNIHASVHVEVDSRVNIMVSHDMIDNMEREINESMHIKTVIHMDPILVDDPETDEYKVLVTNTLIAYNKDITFHDFRIVKGPTHTNLIFDIVIPFELIKNSDEIREDINQLIHSVNPKLLCVIGADQPFSEITDVDDK